MSWDDSNNFWLKGTGPTIAVHDPDGNPNNILQKNLGGSCTVNWSFSGPGTLFLNPTTFTVDLFAGAIGPGRDAKLGSVVVPGSAHTPPWNYTATIAIPANSLEADGEGGPPAASGVYRLAVVINNSVAGLRDQLSGFVEGPIIEIRNP